MVRPIMEKRCGDLLANGGALPRVGPEDHDRRAGGALPRVGPEDDDISAAEGEGPLELRKVSIPALAKMGVHTNRIVGCNPTVGVVDQQQDAVADVYDLLRRASPSSPVQRDLDFYYLLKIAAAKSPDEWAVGLRSLVINNWDKMHEKGYYFLSLYEVALVTMECCRIKAASLKALQENLDISAGCDGGGGGGNGVEGRPFVSSVSTGRETGGEGESEDGGIGGGEEGESDGDVLHWFAVNEREVFLRKLLATAAGATKLSGAPSLPGFSVGALVPDELVGPTGGLDVLLKYGKVSVLLIN